MVVKILGGIDIISGLILLFYSIRIPVPYIVAVFFGILLIAKSLLGMLKEFGGWIDLISGILMIFALIIPIPAIILIVFAFLLFQKGIISFL